MDDDKYQKLLNSAFRFVSFRPRSNREIRNFLVRKLKLWNITDMDLADRVFARMSDLGYADDDKFVSWFITGRHGAKPKGRRVIRQELEQKGIDQETIAAYMDTGGGAQSELDLARKAIAKKLVLWQKLPSPAFKSKAYGFLTRRGFDSQTALRIIDEAAPKDYNTDTD